LAPHAGQRPVRYPLVAEQVFGEAMAGWPTADRAEFARLLRRFVESLAEVTR
jgi:hypothetical protein